MPRPVFLFLFYFYFSYFEFKPQNFTRHIAGLSLYIKPPLRMASSLISSSVTLRTLPNRLHPTPLDPQSYIPATSRSISTDGSLVASFRPRYGTGGVNFKRFCCTASTVDMATQKGKKGNVQVFDSEEALSSSLAKYTADLSEKFTKQRGSFTVVLSGGSLIKSLRKLVEPPYVDSVDWSKWHVFWADERVVPRDHPDSNYLLAYDGLLSKVPILPGNVYSINDSLSAEAAADDYETCVKHLIHNGIIDKSETTGFPKFDLMLLGMGPDGHVASLFPGHPLVHENKQWVTFIKDSPKPPPERITFTFPVINSSANIALVVAGASKAHPVHVALGDGQDSDLLPVQKVAPDGELTWFLDKDAASKL